MIITASTRADLLPACLRSLARFAPRSIPFETIVVLNESGPDAEAELRATVTGVQVVASPVNLGFAGAANRGRALAHGEFLVLLHDDAEIEPGWLEALVEAADAHPEAGAIGGTVLHLDGRLQNAGLILWQDGLTSSPWVGKAPAPNAFGRLRAVDYCGTSSLLVRAAAWDRIGGLDERYYPLYHTDVDLGMALRQIGLVVLYQPASRIRHHLSASTALRFKSFVGLRNWQLFLEKWGAALDEHEPAARDSPAAIKRAMARAESVAERFRRAGPSKIELPAQRTAFDPVQQERRQLERSHALHRAYVKHLTETLDQAEEASKRTFEQDRILRSRSALFRRLVTMLVFGKRAA